MSQFRARTRTVTTKEDVYSVYLPENIVRVGDIDLNKHPTLWKGWNKHNFAYCKMPWDQRQTDYYHFGDKHAGRIFSWMNADKWVFITVIRWDDINKKYTYVGTYKNGYNAKTALGSLTYRCPRLYR